MQWPYAAWGANAVLSGHEHFYARIEDKTTPKLLYMVNGNGGNTHLYGCNEHPLDSARFTVKCDHMNFGATKVKATKDMVVFEYYVATDPTHPNGDTYILRRVSEQLKKLLHGINPSTYHTSGSCLFPLLGSI